MALHSIGVFRGLSHLLEAVFNRRSKFERSWQSYTPRPNTMQTIEGRWHGEWVSEVSGHHGELKCLLSRIGSDHLEAIFLASFLKFLRVGYAAHLSATEAGNGLRLKGNSDLGTLAGGIYEYEGDVNPMEFNCTYRCMYDHGVFRMKRLD